MTLFKRQAGVLISKSSLDWRVQKQSFELVKPIHASSMLPFSHRHFLAILAIGLNAFSGAHAQVLEFLQPTNGAIYSMRDEIPIALRASAPNDVVFSADVFANFHQKIATALYCCPDLLLRAARARSGDNPSDDVSGAVARLDQCSCRRV
jgi:hypothetical protein